MSNSLPDLMPSSSAPFHHQCLVSLPGVRANTSFYWDLSSLYLCSLTVHPMGRECVGPHAFHQWGIILITIISLFSSNPYLTIKYFPLLVVCFCCSCPYPNGTAVLCTPLRSHTPAVPLPQILLPPSCRMAELLPGPDCRSPGRKQRYLPVLVPARPLCLC